MRSWHKNLLIFLLFLVLGMTAYRNSLSNPFQYDDYRGVVQNFNIQNLKNIPSFFINPRLSISDPADAGHYRPFVVTSYAINYAMGGLNPAGYHLVNLAFHVGTAFVIYLIVKAMLGGMGHGSEDTRRGFLTPLFVAAVAAGLIFLVHPFNSEAVNYTTARSGLMSGFFYLLAFYCWVRYRQHGETLYYVATLLAFIFGMLSKEVAVTLPVVLWLYDLFFGGRRLRNLFHWRTYIPYLPFVLIVVIPYLLIRLFSLGRVLDRFRRDIITQILTEIPVLVKHWQMFLFPRGLSLFHDVDIYHGMTWVLFFSAIILLLYIVIAIYAFWIKQERWRIVSFFMFWFFIVLLPTTIIPLNAIFQENRGYLAVVSFSAIAGVLLKELGGKTSGYSVIIILAIFFGGYSILTVQRNAVWQDDVRLWKDAVEKAPRSVRAYAGLSGAYRKRGDLFLSIETAKKGIAVDPEDYEIHVNLGRSYYLAGDLDQAINEYERALHILPEEAVPWSELADLYSEKGDLEHGELYYKKAVNLWSTSALIHYNFGVVLGARGKFQEAIEEFQRAIIIYPQYFRARYELAGLYEKLGRSGEADEQYREILQYNSTVLDSKGLLFGQDRGIVSEIVEKAKQQLDSRNRFKGQR